MSLTRDVFRRSIAASLAIFALALAAAAQEQPQQVFSQIKIKTVIDLRAETEDYSRRAAEAAGLRYVNIPMVEKKYPTEEAVAAFLKIVADPETGKFYLH